MNLIEASYIGFASNRFRKDFKEEKVRSLADSIHRIGLINLPVCRRTPEETLELVAGERRMRAIQLLHSQNLTVRYLHHVIPPPMIPFAFIEEIPDLLAREIELEENIERVDLNWQEVAVATKMLHELRSARDPNWSVRKTAEEIADLRGESSVRPTTIQNRITLAENINNPAIAGAKTEKDAVKALYKELERTFQAELGKRISLDIGVCDQMVKLCRAEEGLQLLKAQSIDCILTDPPYGVDADKFNADTSETHNYSDDRDETILLMSVIFPELYRVMRAKAHLYMFCSFEMFGFWKQMIEADTDLDVWPRPLIWVKDVGHIPRPHFGPSYRYECILYAIKGERCTMHLDGDVIIVPAVKNKIHAAEKPVELLTNLLRRSVYPSNTILDPFCGSGSIFEAAHQVQCSALGFDADPVCVELSNERIKRILTEEEECESTSEATVQPAQESQQ